MPPARTLVQSKNHSVVISAPAECGAINVAGGIHHQAGDNTGCPSASRAVGAGKIMQIRHRPTAAGGRRQFEDETLVAASSVCSLAIKIARGIDNKWAYQLTGKNYGRGPRSRTAGRQFKYISKVGCAVKVAGLIHHKRAEWVGTAVR